MKESRVSVATESGSKYLRQLSKHWSHRFPVRLDSNTAHIDLGNDQSVELSADEACLKMLIKDLDANRLGELEAIVEHHINGFAFRETLKYEWKRS
ncbi:DUF2218 domain-containing protein [Paracidovorax anthurii]|uniref:DUF2218 domain-containing protein n=1 Tax=Paracidovorax anthurii TaxID=78229 RepID=UPI001472ABAB|nr:DUF2218 domain-containing protein [Paracidovorax anthurii]